MAASDVLVGGRYRLVNQLAAGGMGAVWEGWDEVLQRPVAIKRLHPQPGLSRAEADLANSRAMREARITARLHHPNAVPVYDVVEQDGQPCLIMQYLPSQSLHAVLADKGTLGYAMVAGIGAQVASALSAAHEARIVHRDVKPGNVLITEDGSAKLTDFGVSHAHGDVSLTSTNMVTGTPAYLAPEVARGAESTAASDVYSLGSTLYAALEGAPPFGSAQNPMATLHKVASGQFTPPARSGPLTPLLLRMLSPNPADRPPMIDVSRTLHALQSDMSTGYQVTQRIPLRTPPRPQQPGPQHPGPRRPSTPTAALPVARQEPAPSALPDPPPVERDGRRRRGLGIAAALLALVVLLTVGGFSLLGHRSGNGQAKVASPPTTSGAASSHHSSAVPRTTSATRSAAPATTAATSAPAKPSPSATTSAPAGAPTAAQLARAITDYYALLPQNTDQAWQLLTPAYQSGTSRNRASYQAFWDSMQQVAATDAVGKPAGGAEATITYYFKDGRVATERTAYGLIPDGGVLKIDSSSVLSSRTQ